MIGKVKGGKNPISLTHEYSLGDVIYVQLPLLKGRYECTPAYLFSVLLEWMVGKSFCWIIW